MFIKYGTALEMVRPKLLGRTELNIGFFGAGSSIPEENDLSAICSKGQYIYLAGEKNKMIYRVTVDPTSNKIIFNEKYDYPYFPGTEVKVQAIIGMATANNGTQEYIYILGINEDNIMVLFRMTDTLEVDEYFVVDDGQQTWPKWHNSEKHGRGIYSDGISLFLSGGQYAEKIIKINQQGRPISEYHRGDPIYTKISSHGSFSVGWSVSGKTCYVYYYNGIWTYYNSPNGTVEKPSKSEIMALIVQDINQYDLYGLRTLNGQDLNDNNIELEFCDSISGREYYRIFNYRKQMSPYPYSSGLSAIHGKPYMVNRSSNKVGTDGEAQQALIRLKDKTFVSAANGVIKGLEPFTTDYINPSFIGDLHYDGQFLWAVQAGTVFKFEMLYHCFIVDGQACEDIDLEKISSGETKVKAVELKNVSEGTMTNITLTLNSESAAYTYTDFLDGATPVKTLALADINPGMTGTFDIQANLPGDYTSDKEERFVGLIEVSYKTKY